MKVPEKNNGRLEIYAGIDDGYSGSVPVSHSILFYNRLARVYGMPENQVSCSDMVNILTRGTSYSNTSPVIGDKKSVVSEKSKVFIFDNFYWWT